MSRSGEEDVVGAIVSRIGLLFERAHGGVPAPEQHEIEEVLADGYACLIALEADRARLARRSAELFAGGSAVPSAARELRGLNARLLSCDLDIARLRSLLAELRDYAAQTQLAG
jgi:hypothetical protein